MATHSSVLALRIPGMGLPGMGCSFFENPRWAAVYGVAQSRTRLKRLSSSSNQVLSICAKCWKRKTENFAQNKWRFL